MARVSLPRVLIDSFGHPLPVDITLCDEAADEFDVVLPYDGCGNAGVEVSHDVTFGESSLEDGSDV